MSDGGPLGVSNGQGEASAHARGRTAASILGGGDRTTAIYLGMIRLAFDEATPPDRGQHRTGRHRRGTDGAAGCGVECGNRELDEVVRQAGSYLAERRIDTAHVRSRWPVVTTLRAVRMRLGRAWGRRLPWVGRDLGMTGDAWRIAPLTVTGWVVLGACALPTVVLAVVRIRRWNWSGRR